MKNHLDHKNTTEWALAHVDGVSFVGSLQKFMLANRVTGRAHALYFAGGGFTLGFSKPKGPTSNPNLSYTSFRTTQAVQFSDFEGKGARISSIGLPIFSKTYFIIYATLNPFGRSLGKITMGGFTLPKLSVSGQAFVNGAIHIDYGDGKVHGLIVRVLDIKEKFAPSGPRDAHYSVKPREAPLVVLPSDVMFEFDSHALKSKARSALMDALVTIEMRNDHQQVVIEGHTDSKGSPSYNEDLSVKRANAVKQWLSQNGCEGASYFIAKGFGETRPIASNELPDGRDNKKGRAQNRRVEIRYKYQK